MIKRRILWNSAWLLLLFCLFLLLLPIDSHKAMANSAPPEGNYVSENLDGMSAYANFDSLPYLTNDILSEQRSSTDPYGGNNDGYGWQDNREGDVSNIKDKVLLDAVGPGIVYRMWFTGNTDSMSNGRIRFYFDNETTPSYDLSYTEFFSGKTAPFLEPFVLDSSESSGGYTVMLPIAFKDRIIITADMPFYFNINYQILPSDTKIETFNGSFDQATYDLAVSNMTPSRYTEGENLEKQFSISPQQEYVIANISGKKQIKQIQLKIPDLMTLKDFETDPIEDDGVAFGEGGYISFDVDIDENNEGIKLVRRVDAGISDQIIDVYVDDAKLSESWNSGQGSAGYNWLDCEYEIPAEYTSGRSSVNIRLEYVRSSGSDANAFYIWTYSKLNGTYQLTDEFDVSYEKLDSGKPEDKNFIGENITWNGERSYQYPPILDNDNLAKYEKSTQLTKQLWIQIYYNEETSPSVSAPIGSFFGFGEAGAAEFQSYMLGFQDGVLYCNFPMPFEQSAKIVLVNNSEYTVENVDAYINYEDFEGDFKDVGYFKTQYSTYTPTKEGEYMTVLSQGGSGHFVGIVQTMIGDPSREYLEGDELIYIDGSKTASFYGTGTEDLYNGAWYFSEGTFYTPWYGNPVHTTVDEYDATTCYRLFLADKISFRSSIDFKFEHGPSNNTSTYQYILAFYYHNDNVQIQLTDKIDLGNKSSLGIHSYESSGGNLLTRNSGYDGLYRDIYTEMTFNYFDQAGSHSSFIININENNEGIILRKSSDQSVESQRACVYVNGTLVGEWNSRTSYTADYINEDSFFIPKSFTDGYSQVQIKIVAQDNWTEGDYYIYSVRDFVNENGNENVVSGEEPKNTGLIILYVVSAVSFAGAICFITAAVVTAKRKDKHKD